MENPEQHSRIPDIKMPPPYQGPQINPYPNYSMPGMPGEPVDLSGSKTSLVCGIIGLIMFWNPAGLVLNMIALVKGGTAMSVYSRMKDRYTEKSFRDSRAGKNMGLVGLVLFFILFFFLMATGALDN